MAITGFLVNSRPHKRRVDRSRPDSRPYLFESPTPLDQLWRGATAFKREVSLPAISVTQPPPTPPNSPALNAHFHHFKWNPHPYFSLSIACRTRQLYHCATLRHATSSHSMIQVHFASGEKHLHAQIRIPLSPLYPQCFIFESRQPTPPPR